MIAFDGESEDARHRLTTHDVAQIEPSFSTLCHPATRWFGRAVSRMIAFRMSPAQFGSGGAKLDRSPRIDSSNLATSAAKSSTGVLDPPL